MASSPSLAAPPAQAPHRVVDRCRVCGAELQPFLSLGELPLPDALLTRDALERREPRYPLDVAVCSGCSLVQILEEVPPQTLFVDNYLYFSSCSDDLLRHAREEAVGLVRERGLDGSSFVVEIASNDGYLLRNIVELGVPVLGIDPAPTQAAAAVAAGVPTLVEFFDAGLGRALRETHGPADVIVANNVLAHTPDPNSMMGGIAALLAEEGVAAIENTYVRDLVDGCAFDTIYHEHFSYFSCTSIAALAGRHGLHLNRVEHFPHVQGGSLRWHLGRRQEPQPSAAAYLAAEREDGLDSFAYYATFGSRVDRLRAELLELLRSLRAEGARIAAYGAAAKGTILLNTVGIDAGLVEYVVDRNPHKAGLFMPGVHLPIHPPERLLEDRPDYLLLLAWNYADEIVRQQGEYARRGGRFVLPVPEPRLL